MFVFCTSSSSRLFILYSPFDYSFIYPTIMYHLPYTIRHPLRINLRPLYIVHYASRIIHVAGRRVSLESVQRAKLGDLSQNILRGLSQNLYYI